MRGGLRRRLDQVLEGLRTHEAVDLLEGTLRAPVPSEVLDAVEAALGARLPPGARDLYSSCDGFRVRWQERDHQGDDLATGTMDVRPLAEVFAAPGAEGVLGGPVERAPVRPLDLFAAEACVGFAQPVGGEVPRTLRLQVFGERGLDTGFDTTGYLERLLVSRGTFYWAMSLCAGHEELDEVHEFRARARRLFADYDDGLFAPGT